MKRPLVLFVLILLVTGWLVPTAVAQTTPEVHAVFFFSPTCPHCHEVIENVLPVLDERFGKAWQLLSIDVTRPAGSRIYEAYTTRFRVPRERLGVPAIVIGETVLVGSQEIPDQLPGLIEEALAAGGLGLPDLAGVETAVSDSFTGESRANTSGLGLGWLVMLGMLAALTYGLWQLFTIGWSISAWTKWYNNLVHLPPLTTWVMPSLLLLGLAIAGYLSYVELTKAEAVCGPIGQCDVVQSSAFAYFLGLPVALLGLLNYGSTGALWLVQRQTNGRFFQLALAGLVGFTMLATLFSVYLTAVELLILQAICLWCLLSAVVATLLMLLVVTGLAREQRRLRLARHRPKRQTRQASA